MSASAVFRLNLPQILVLSKSDILSDKEIEKIVGWSENHEKLYEDLLNYVKRGLSDDLYHMARETGLFRPVTPVSAINGTGIEDIYDGIQELFYGGEDLEKMLF